MPSTPTGARGGVKASEVLAFAGVVLLVAVLVLPRVHQSNVRARQEKAARDIATLSTALDKYRIDNGRYPTKDQGLKALREAPTAAPLPKHWAGPYLQRAVPRDPWGKDYIYVCPGGHNPNRFDLFSKGADGKDGGHGDGADVGNWE